MRELKFKAWHPTDFNEEGKPINYEMSPPFTLLDIQGSPIDLENYPFLFSLDEHTTLIQSTGARDKRGQEIYEGDIWRVGNRIYVVEFDKKTLSYVAAYNSSNFTSSTKLIPTQGEVVGNIFNKGVKV